MTPTSYWAKLEAEGRLKQETGPSSITYLGHEVYHYQPHEPYFTLRLTEEERERLKYPQPQIHTNLEVLGE